MIIVVRRHYIYCPSAACVPLVKEEGFRAKVDCDHWDARCRPPECTVIEVGRLSSYAQWPAVRSRSSRATITHNYYDSTLRLA